MITADTFVSLALDQAGDRYRFGAEASPGDADPDVFDCSELIEWVGRRLDVSPRIPDGSWYQYRHCHNHKKVVAVGRALETRGALLFRFRGGDPLKGGRPSSSHVAISLGDTKRTMEARSTAAGVGVFGGASGRDWTHAALIPGVAYDAASEWAEDDWQRGTELGITNGARPRAAATREEVVIMAMRAAERLG